MRGADAAERHEKYKYFCVCYRRQSIRWIYFGAHQTSILDSIGMQCSCAHQRVVARLVVLMMWHTPDRYNRGAIHYATNRPMQLRNFYFLAALVDRYRRATHCSLPVSPSHTHITALSLSLPRIHTHTNTHTLPSNNVLFGENIE